MSNKLNNARALATRFRAHPIEAFDRLVAIAEVRYERIRERGPGYGSRTWESALEEMGRVIGHPLDRFVQEPELREIEDEVVARATTSLADAPFPIAHNASFDLARCCYVLTRALAPTTVLETGVGYGVNSSFLLQALAVNGTGCLHSVDLPPLGKDAMSFQGVLVPDRLRARWELHAGYSNRLFPTLLPTLGPIDMFVHDSLHTRRTMTREFSAVAPHLAARWVVVADDISENVAFDEWVARSQPDFASALVQPAKHSHFGVSIKSARP
jgi:hypothetical protein